MVWLLVSDSGNQVSSNATGQEAGRRGAGASYQVPAEKATLWFADQPRAVS